MGSTLTVQVNKSAILRNGEVIGHRHHVLNKKQPSEADDTMPSVDEASKLLIRSLLIQDKIDLARNVFH